MKVHAVQLDQAWEDKEANYDKATRLINEAGVNKGDLIVLPETFPTCFSMNVELTTKNEPEKTEGFLSDLAKKYGAWVTSGMTIPSETDNKGHNVSVTFSPEGERIGFYAKTHPAAIYREHESYDPGNEIVTFPLGGFTVCPFICYDLRFPEIFRIGTRAIENLSYVIGVNRTGNDPQLEYCGRTVIIDPHGKILTDAENAETIVSAEIDLNVVMEWRRKFPVLEHAREDFKPRG